ncbi:MAG: DUF4783 domain-containing protein [Cytophagales bacterium]|nr:MAG: DUF4783 domain-containing protein [Cytophagales bacterium]
MNNFANTISLKVFIFALLVAFCTKLSAQDDVISSAKTAIKANNSKELSKYFNEMIDLGFDGEKGSYSKTQAEFVIKDFFSRNPVTDFQFVHKGASKEGLTYTIGNYQSKSKEYRVLIYVKEIKGSYKIDYLDFSKE